MARASDRAIQFHGQIRTARPSGVTLYGRHRFAPDVNRVMEFDEDTPSTPPFSATTDRSAVTSARLSSTCSPAEGHRRPPLTAKAALSVAPFSHEKPTGAGRVPRHLLRPISKRCTVAVVAPQQARRTLDPPPQLSLQTALIRDALSLDKQERERPPRASSSD